jgi:hypothetical protein
MIGRGEHDRRVLQIHQDHVRAAGLERLHAARDDRLQAIGTSAPCDVIRAELPDDKIRFGGKNVAIEAGDVAGNRIADAATVDDLDIRIEPLLGVRQWCSQGQILVCRKACFRHRADGRCFCETCRRRRNQEPGHDANAALD